MSTTGPPAKSDQTTGKTSNPRGIPYAPFVANVDEHLKGVSRGAETALREFQEAIAKYKYMEQNLAQRRKGLEEKIPDIKKTLDMVKFLDRRRKVKAGELEENDDEALEGGVEEEAESGELVTTFELNDTLYAQAKLEDTDTVYLWLGANVMLSYPIPESIALLTSKLALAQTSLEHAITDLMFLREQITIMEVNTARVYNWDVKRRRLEREEEEGEKEKGG